MMLLLFYWLTCIPKVTTAACAGVKVPTVAFTVTAAAQFAAAPAGIVATVPSVVAAPNAPGAPAGKQVPPVLKTALAGEESDTTTLVTLAVPLLVAVMR